MHEHHDRIVPARVRAAPGRRTWPRSCRRRGVDGTCTNCGCDPVDRLERRRARVGQLARRAAAGVDDRQLRRQVAAPNDAPAAACRRATARNPRRPRAPSARAPRRRRRRPRRLRSRPGRARLHTNRSACRRPTAAAARLPNCPTSAARGLPSASTIQLRIAGLLGQEPQRASSGIQPKSLKFQLIQASSCRWWRDCSVALRRSRRSRSSDPCCRPRAPAPRRCGCRRSSGSPGRCRRHRSRCARRGCPSSASLPAALRSAASGSSSMPGNASNASLRALPAAMSTSHSVCGSGALRPTQRARVLDFHVTRFGHVARQLADLPGLAGLGGGDHQQPAAVGRQRAVGDLRRRRPGTPAPVRGWGRLLRHASSCACAASRLRLVAGAGCRSGAAGGRAARRSWPAHRGPWSALTSAAWRTPSAAVQRYQSLPTRHTRPPSLVHCGSDSSSLLRVTCDSAPLRRSRTNTSPLRDEGHARMRAVVDRIGSHRAVRVRRRRRAPPRRHRPAAARCRGWSAVALELVLHALRPSQAHQASSTGRPIQSGSAMTCSRVSGAARARWRWSAAVRWQAATRGASGGLWRRGRAG